MSDDRDTRNASWADPSPVEHGGRVELRLVEDKDGATRYAARWYTAQDQLEGEVLVRAEGAQGSKDAPPVVTLHAPGNLPEWLGAFTTSLVRTTARRSVQEGAWPRRLTRWRKSPEEKAE